jgi:hypothetical protein
MSATSSPTAFLNVATGKPAEHTPVWFMRQAGRSLPEYRAVRGEGSILDAIKQPRLAADITLQPVARYGVDAAVLYSDIVVPAHAVGFGIDVAPGTGPVAEKPFRTVADLQRLRPLDPEADTPYVLETVRMLASELRVPLLAFNELQNIRLHQLPANSTQARKRFNCSTHGQELFPTRNTAPWCCHIRHTYLRNLRSHTHMLQVFTLGLAAITCWK